MGDEPRNVSDVVKKPLALFKVGRFDEAWTAAEFARCRDHVGARETQSLADVTMRTVAANLDVLERRLVQLGWQYGWSDRERAGAGRYMEPNGVRAYPDEKSAEFLNALTPIGVPYSVRAFIEHVGAVCFVGHHAFLPYRQLDALVVDFERRLQGGQPEWRERILVATKAHLSALPSRCATFELAFAPDAAMKVGVSGSGGYTVQIQGPTADAGVETDGFDGPFVGYLRYAILDWGGLPGARYVVGPKREAIQAVVASLRDGLMPF